MYWIVNDKNESSNDPQLSIWTIERFKSLEKREFQSPIIDDSSTMQTSTASLESLWPDIFKPNINCWGETAAVWPAVACGRARVLGREWTASSTFWVLVPTNGYQNPGKPTQRRSRNWNHSYGHRLWWHNYGCRTGVLKNVQKVTVLQSIDPQTAFRFQIDWQWKRYR